VSELIEGVQTGHYARKQIFSRSAIVAWSHRSRFRFARKIVEPYAARRLLDYGCGDGTFLAQVCDLFPNAAGGDVDSRQNEDCRKRFAAHPGISFLSIDELEQPAHRGVYDIVTCMEVLEHCIPDTTEKVIGDLRRLVAPGGTVVISVPIEIGPTLLGKQMIRAIAGWRSIGDYKFREKYTAAELATMLLADERTAIQRPIHTGPDGSQPSHGHKGFNWRALRYRLQDSFEIRTTRFSPLEFLRGYASSQAWLICAPRRRS
jgi:2-polyprenyl-3-methyl-5-hydroxy-6-metoxy-1,4-benzoquinol methylase